MSQRSVTGILNNQTNYKLTFVSIDVTDGELSSKPPETIPGGGQGTWETQNSSDFTGTGGTITYGGVDSNNNNFSVTCNWSDPFIGDDQFSISTTLIGGQATYSSADGNNAVVNYYLS